MNSKAGTLYIVATPIGNLDDITSRALTILSQVDLCAAEDTRKTKILFNNYSIGTRLTSYHKFSERKKLEQLLEFLKKGKDLALVSDAGTPLISDPGFLLVSEALSLNINICPIPGPSSVLSGLSVSGFSADKFQFIGFVPKKASARNKFIEDLLSTEITTVVFESGLRIKKFLEDVGSQEPNKRVCVSREITKIYETHYRGTTEEVLEELKESKFGTKGEFVLIFEGFKKLKKETFNSEDRRVIKILLENLPNKQALIIGSKLLNIKKNFLYKTLLQDKE